jgi:hypothetical protein
MAGLVDGYCSISLDLCEIINDDIIDTIWGRCVQVHEGIGDLFHHLHSVFVPVSEVAEYIFQGIEGGDLFECAKCGAVRELPNAGWGDYAPDGCGDPLCGPCMRKSMSCPEYSRFVSDGTDDAGKAGA